MNILICDDVQSEREHLKKIVEAYCADRLDGQPRILIFENGESACTCREKADIAFLDIQMGDVDGLRVQECLWEKNPAVILVMVTGHPQFVNAALRRRAFRFLLKPYATEEAFRVLEEACERQKSLPGREILFDGPDGPVALRPEEILFLSVNGHRLTVETASHSFPIRGSLEEYEKKLPAERFARPHRSFLVNLEKVLACGKDEVILRDKPERIEEVIPLSRRCRKEFVRKFLLMKGRQAEERL